MHTLPFDDEFDWAELPSDPSPEPWVRPVAWLEEIRDTRDWERFGEYVAVMTERDAAPHAGYCPIVVTAARNLPVPWDMVVEEFMGQSLFIPHAGELYRLTVGEPTASPLTQAVGLVSCTRTNGQRWQPVDGKTIGALDAAWRWTDQLVATTVEEAAGVQQPFYVVWDRDRLELRAGVEIIHEAPARLTRAVRTCPMLPESKPGQMCQQYGGPWVSASIRASGYWMDEHSKRLRDVGCDTCGARVRIPCRSGTWMVFDAGDRDPRYGIGPTRYTHPVAVAQQ